MPVLDINGIGKVEVGQEFLSLPADRQAQEVDAIVAHVKGGAASTEAPTAPDAPASMSMLDVAKGAASNAIPSAIQAGHDLIQPVVHPVDTAVAIKNLGAGILQKVGIVSGDDQVKYADAVGKFFVDRYGSVEGIKNAIATDPVGVLMDVSTVLTAGGGLAARTPGLVGKVGEVAATAGRAIDPVANVGRAVNAGGRVAAEVIGGVGTGAGPGALIEAAKAGYEGGERAKVFTEAMRHDAPIGEVVTEAKSALDTMRKERGAAYRSTMAEIGKDNTVLDFGKIDNAVKATQDIKNYKGQDLSPTTGAVRDEINTAIAEWKKLDPKEFHTAEGLDALKQKVGDIRDGAAFGTPERKVADSAYGAIRQTIIDQAPDYAKVMKGYEQASDIIKEVENTLSLGKNANVDTAVRKLQSVLRNNVNANFGKRGELAQYLVDAGAVNLLSKLAGQSLSAWTPQGMGKLVAGGAGILGVGGHLTPATAVGLAAASSPRMAGEAAKFAGNAKFMFDKAAKASKPSFQLGRLSRLQPQY
jgi:hypothetical protein